MHIRTVSKCLLITALILISSSPSEASVSDLLFGGLSDALYKGGKYIIKSVADFGLGGGTAIVYDAINLNYFGVGPRIRKFVGGAIDKGGSAITSGSGNLLWKVVPKVLGAGKDAAKKIFKLKKDAVWWVGSFFIPVVKSDTETIIDINVQIDESKNIARNTRSAEPLVKVLRGRRESDITQYSTLRDSFATASQHDHLQCLPLVMCAIYADHDSVETPLESKFKRAFRSLFPKKFTPNWASEYMKAAEVGETSKSSATCQKAYPSCNFPPEYLRKLISQALKSYLRNEGGNKLYT